MGEKRKPATICIQSGWKPKNGEPRVLPIYQSTTFKYDTTEEMGRLFDLKDNGYFYTRCQNPTNDLVAAKIADLEGGVAAVLTSSGQSAIFYSIFNICEAGDHVICASAIYGGTLNVLGVTAKKMGISCTFVDVDASKEELDKAFQPNTKAVVAETIANPSLVVLDIEKMAEVAHSHGVPLIVDNTFATPVNCRPFEWGADIVTHSTTKYMDGHAAQVGGAIVDSGNFDWEAHKEKFPGLTTPDESYHGVVYTKQFGKAAYITKINAQLMRDLGSIPSPMNCFILNLGLESLVLRVRAVAGHRDRTARPVLPDDQQLPRHEERLARRQQLRRGRRGALRRGIPQHDRRRARLQHQTRRGKLRHHQRPYRRGEHRSHRRRVHEAPQPRRRRHDGIHHRA